MATETLVGGDQPLSSPPSAVLNLNLVDLNGPAAPKDKAPVVATKPTTVLDLSAPIYPKQPTNSAQAPDAAAKVEPAKNLTPEQRRAADLTEEAGFTPWTKAALMRDAKEFPPVKNDDGSTTYTLMQSGISNREPSVDKNKVDYYQRKVSITVPEGAQSLKDCTVKFDDREAIGQDAYQKLLSRDQEQQAEIAQGSGAKDGKLNRPNDVILYTHGVMTSANDSDFDALTLQLAQGHSIVNVDWACDSAGASSKSAAYDKDCQAAKDCSDPFQKALDTTVSQIGAGNTDLVGFSHGAMFDLRYLAHRRDSNADPLNAVILTHPDIIDGNLSKENHSGKGKQLFPSVASNSFVIGSTSDEALVGGELNSATDGDLTNIFSSSFREKYANGTRLGDGSTKSQKVATDSGAIYIQEDIPEGKKSTLCHFVNYDGIARLLNASDTDASQLVQEYSSDANQSKPAVTANK